MRGAPFGKLSFITKNFSPQHPSWRADCSAGEQNTKDRNRAGRKTNATPASHRGRIVRGAPVLTFPPLGGGRRFWPDSAHEAHRICLKRAANHDPEITKLQAMRWPAALSCSMSGMGEEAATPGQPVHACAYFLNVPRQFTLENRRLPLALPQSSGELRNLSRFRCTHSVTLCCGSQQEIARGLCRSCGR
jgi:hypothetical protein